jgi:uncharacterized protein (DUF433 family)
MVDRTEFAKWLRNTRANKRLTLREVGERAGKSGAYISIHEQATNRRLRPETVDMLASALADTPAERAQLVREARSVAGYAVRDSGAEGVIQDETESLMHVMETVARRTEDPLLARITVNPAIFGGKPIIRGKRLAVEHILGMMAAGDDPATLLDGYPWLEMDDIKACLAYARRMVANERIESIRIESTR